MPFLIGTKFDMFIKLKESYKEDINKTARKFAKKMDAPVMYCSADQSLNIKRIFQIIISKVFYMNKNQSYIIAEAEENETYLSMDYDHSVGHSRSSTVVEKYDDMLVNNLVNYGIGTYAECLRRLSAASCRVNFWDINSVVDSIFTDDGEEKAQIQKTK